MWQSQQIAAIQIANQMLYAMSAPSSYSLNQRPPNIPHPAMEENTGDTDDEDDEQSRTLYVGNLDDRVTDELLYEVFLQAGPLEAVRIPKDNNGRQRSFGFIVYSHRCTPAYATKLFAGLTLYRKTISIKLQNDPYGAQKRRSLPTDFERYMPRPGDNSMLRSTSYPNFYDPSLNDNNLLTKSSNPFRTDSPDSTQATSSRISRERERDRDSDRDRGTKHSITHQRSHPYKRDERRQRGEGNRNRR